MRGIGRTISRGNGSSGTVVTGVEERSASAAGIGRNVRQVISTNEIPRMPERPQSEVTIVIAQVRAD